MADRLADSALLKGASSNSDDWDDATWAAWFRAAERAASDRRDRVAQLEAEVAELRNQRDTAERHASELDAAREWALQLAAEHDAFTGLVPVSELENALRIATREVTT